MLSANAWQTGIAVHCVEMSSSKSKLQLLKEKLEDKVKTMEGQYRAMVVTKPVLNQLDRLDDVEEYLFATTDHEHGSGDVTEAAGPHCGMLTNVALPCLALAAADRPSVADCEARLCAMYLERSSSITASQRGVPCRRGVRPGRFDARSKARSTVLVVRVWDAGRARPGV